jgi:hypothetical protein
MMPSRRALMRRLPIAATVVVSLAIVTSVGPAAMSPQSDPWPALVARAKDVVDRLASGDVEPVLSTLTDRMKAAIDAERLRGIFPSVVVQAGAFKSLIGARTEARGGVRLVIVACAFERANVDVQVAFDQADRIAGLTVRPAASTVAYSAPAYVTPSAFRDEAVTVDRRWLAASWDANAAARRRSFSRRGPRPRLGPKRSR